MKKNRLFLSRRGASLGLLTKRKSDARKVNSQSIDLETIGVVGDKQVTYSRSVAIRQVAMFKAYDMTNSN